MGSFGGSSGFRRVLIANRAWVCAPCVCVFGHLHQNSTGSDQPLYIFRELRYIMERSPPTQNFFYSFDSMASAEVQDRISHVSIYIVPLEELEYGFGYTIIRPLYTPCSIYLNLRGTIFTFGLFACSCWRFGSIGLPHSWTHGIVEKKI